MFKRLASHALVLSATWIVPAAARAHGFELQVQQLDESDPAAVVNGESYTVGDLKNLVALRADSNAESFIFFSVTDLLEAGRLDPAYEKLGGEARAEGVELSDDDRQEIESFLRNYIERQIFAENVTAMRGEPTEEAIRASYESQLEQRFRLPERMVVRQFHFAATENSTGEPEANAAWERLQAGEAVPGTSGIVELESVKRELPELHKILRSIEDNEYSRPFPFRDGYSIAQRQLLIPGAYMPLESVYDLLREEWINEEDARLTNQFFSQVAEETRLVRVHPQNLVNAGALAFDSDILLSVGDRDFTRGELRAIVGWQLAPDVPHSERTFTDMVLKIAPVQRALIDYLIGKDDLMSSEEVQELRKSAEDTALVRELLDRRFAEEQPNANEEDAAGQRLVFELEVLKEAAEDAEFKSLIDPAQPG